MNDDTITTNISDSKPMTRERLEAGFQAMMDWKQPPDEHIMHPRFERGEWTQCSCGMYHRRVNGELETGPVYADGEWSFPA
jgi:hypothetical protein